MKNKSMLLAALLACTSGSLSVQAADLGKLSEKAGGLLGGGADSTALLSAAGLSAPDSVGNAAGVLSYCIKNNYLSADKATAMKDQLLGKVGLAEEKEAVADESYLSGLSGMISGKDGNSFSLDSLKGDLKDKACDFVLDHADSLL